LNCAYQFVGGHRSMTPEQVAQAYFDDWRNGGLGEMSTLVADPPADFAEQHRTLSRGLGVTAIRLDPGPVVRKGTDGARADFTVTRTLSPGDVIANPVTRPGRPWGSAEPGIGPRR
jgi:hypothetical protein